MRLLIAYNRHEHDIAVQMRQDLQDAGHLVWLSCLDQPHPKHALAVKKADYVILFRKNATIRSKRVIIAHMADDVLAQIAPGRSRRWILLGVAGLVLMVSLFGLLLYSGESESATIPDNIVGRRITLTPLPLTPSATSSLSHTATVTPSPLTTATPSVDYTATLNALENALYGSPTPEAQLNDGDGDLPFASIYAEPAAGVAPLTVTFFNDTIGDAVEFVWDLDGDGVTDSTDFEPPSFTYTEPGEYVATLTALNADGEGETSEMRIIVYGENEEDVNSTGGITPTPTSTPRPTPEAGEVIASFAMNPSTGDAPLVVSFVNDTLGEAASYTWDFDGEGMPESREENPEPYTYNTPGEYTVTLTVVSTTGVSDTITGRVIVYTPGQDIPRPNAAFSVSPQSGAAPLTVTFTDESTGDVNLYLWDFDGDGATDTRDVNPAPYTYDTPGTYQARLLVRGPGGVAAPAYQEIVVNAAEPTATLTQTTTLTPTRTPTLTATLIPSWTPTLIPTWTPTFTPTLTPTPTVTMTQTVTTTPTTTPTPSPITPTGTLTPTPTTTPTATLTQTMTPTVTLTLTPTATVTSTLTSTSTPTPTPTPTPTLTPVPSLP